MKSLIRFLIAYSLLANSLFSEEVVHESKDLPTNENLTHANLLAIPCSIVDNKVNVITGDFLQCEVDHVIPSQNPMYLERNYCSSGGGRMAEGWSLNRFSHYIWFYKSKKSVQDPDHPAGPPSYIINKSIYFSEAPGASTEFKLCSCNVRYITHYSELCRGMTNCGKGEISGKTNHKNLWLSLTKKSSYSFDKKQAFSIQEGDNTVHKFQKIKKEENPIIIETKYPNKNTLSYIYPSEDMKTILCTQRSKANKYIASFSLNYSKKDKNSSEIVTKLCDGRKVIYQMSYIEKFRCLTYVDTPENPSLRYQYKFKKGDNVPRICQINSPESRVLKIQYYENQEYHKNKVKSISQPVGETAELFETYKFKYTRPETMRTEVQNVYNRKTSYEFNENQQLTCIAKYGNRNSPYRKDKFYWETKVNVDYGNLKAHVIVDEKGGNQFLYSYVYDGAGNPIQEHIYGNLSGQNIRNPMLDNNYNPVETECEVFTKTNTFSNDKFNLKTSEVEGRSKIEYTYYPDSDKLKSKFILDGDTIKERHFYSYDDEGSITREIEDDGITPNVDDLTGATQRLIHYAKNNDQYPTFLPYEQREVYLDENNQERCAKRIVNIYNSYCKLIKQHHYDNTNTLRYTLEWDYDEKGNPIKEVDALGQVTKHQYDANKNRILTQGPNQAYHVKFSYDYMNRLTKVEKIDNKTGETFPIEYKYDKRGNRIAIINDFGNATEFTYDEFDRLIKTSLPEVHNSKGEIFRPTQEVEYDVFGFITSTKDAEGNITLQQNTVRGTPYQINHPDGSQEQFIYNFDGTLKEKFEKNGTIIRYTYDYKKRPTQTETYSSDMVLLASQTIEYNNFHPIKEVDALGHVTTYEYDRQGRLTKVIKEDSETHHGYDSLGRRNRTKQFFGHNPEDYVLECYEYDLLDRIIEKRTEDSSGNIFKKETYVYDSEGNKIQIHIHGDEGISTTLTTYNIHNLPTSIVDALGNTTYIHYKHNYKNEYGIVVPYTEAVDSKGNMTVSIGTTMGKIAKLQKITPFGQLLQQREFFYDGNEKLIETKETVITPGLPNREIYTQWTYDAMGQLIELIEAVGTPEQKRTQHKYNPFGQKIETIKPDGTTLYLSYHPKGLLSNVTSSDQTLSYAYTYDLNNNPIQIDDRIHNTTATRKYDRNERLIEENFGNTLSISYTYDRQGKTRSVKLPDNSTIAYTYSPVNLLEVKKFDPDQKELYSQIYQHNLEGKLKQKILPFNLGTVTYTYDPLKRYLSMESPYFSEKDLVYDKSNNILARTLHDPLGKVPCSYNYDDLDQILKEEDVSTHTYKHDSLFNRVHKDGFDFPFNALNQILHDQQNPYQYDLNGNLVERAGQKYIYDAWDRLITVQDNDKKYDYTYDDLGRRLSKIASAWNPLTNEWTVQEIQYFLFQGGNEIGVCDEKKHFSELRILGQGKGGDVGAAITFEIKGEVYVPITDYMGHTRVLLNKAGKTIDIYRFTTFGEEVCLDTQGNIKTPIAAWRYCSKRYDPETKLLYFGKRYYDPSLGRWITADPLGYEAGPNLYAYAGNNPLILLDIYGLKYDHFEMQRDKRFYESLRRDSTESNRQETKREREPATWSGFESLITRENYSQIRTFIGPNGPFLYKDSIGFVNGMNNKLNEADGHTAYISDLAGGYDVKLTYNSTKNEFVDVVECVLGTLGIATTPVELIMQDLREFHETHPPEQKCLRIVTSQGAIHMKNALLRLPPEIQQRVFVVAIAPGAYIDRSICADVRHYRAEPWRDLVPRLDIVGGFRCSDTIKTLPSHPDADLFDHSVQSPTYKEVIKNHLKEFINSGGKKI